MKKPITIDNYKKLLFSKIISEDHVNIEDAEKEFFFDIIIPFDEEMSSLEESTMYINRLVYKLYTLPTAKREEFIDYQILKYGNHAQTWLKEIDGMLNDYSEEINTYKSNLVNDYRTIISQRLKFRVGIPLLVWNYNDIDLYILTKALYLIKAIDTDTEHPANQNTIEYAFSTLFGMEEKAKDASRKLTSLKERSLGYIDFMEKLKEVWDIYREEKTK